MEENEMYSQKELLDMYGDIIDGDTYLLAECGKGYTPKCYSYYPNGTCRTYATCN